MTLNELSNIGGLNKLAMLGDKRHILNLLSRCTCCLEENLTGYVGLQGKVFSCTFNLG